MARIQIPIDVLTSRLNMSDRFASLRNTSLSSRFANMRPLREFFDFKRLSKPENFTEVQSRVNYNLGTFSSNYALVFVLLSIYALITNRLLLFDVVLFVGGLWLLGRLNGQDLVIGTFQATSSQLYTGLMVTCGLLFLIASPFTTVLWLIGASGVVICGHAAFMEKPIDEAFSGEAV
ncbi:PRA1 family protein-domain-containing protein [Microdochium bolleyi]|uniref:PRA1 family protein n=1 Tax=Microdochium bolleyi TaxID=196109 RepID=A0A136J320_9PEZI|nr:PRA1 family protein-domain-containing protein [Microdochium bolleyi]